MPIRIDDAYTELLPRKIAELTGETLTEAIGRAMAEKYERLLQARLIGSVADELNSIALRCANRPVLSQMSADEILGYDETGIPTR